LRRGLGLILVGVTSGQRLDENAPGFGFGLSITRELLELYRGTLVLPEAPPRGLRLTLRLPLVRHGR
jgi:signal transduction histidine kinase